MSSELLTCCHGNYGDPEAVLEVLKRGGLLHTAPPPTVSDGLPLFFNPERAERPLQGHVAPTTVDGDEDDGDE